VSPTGRHGAALVAAIALAVCACNHAPRDATPEGAVRMFIEEMESSADDFTAMKRVYELLGPSEHGVQASFKVVR